MGDKRTRRHVFGRRPRWLRALAVGLALAAVAVVVLSLLSDREPDGPQGFYAAPGKVPERPGALLRSEPFSRGVPDDAVGWRILYTTTRDDDTPALASGLVVVPRAAAAGPRPVIAWAHGTTGFAEQCAPSLLEKPFEAGALPGLEQVVSHGWALVATDYVGLGTKGPHPYLIGQPEARSVLDAVRAARQIEGLELGPRTVVWGHSQGGAAALWTGIVAPRYAPDAGVVGVAALAPATELPALLDAGRDESVGKIIGSYALAAYAAAYPDVDRDDYIRPEAGGFVRETAGRCLAGPDALLATGTPMVPGDRFFSRALGGGALGRRLEENIPNGLIEAPVLVAQGLDDELVVPGEQRRFVDGLCELGQSSLEYRTYGGLDHVALVLGPDTPLVPDLVAWTDARLAGTPQAPGCRTVRG